MSSDVATVVASGMPALARVDQVCVLVDDVEHAITEYSSLFAITRWRGYRYGPDNVPDLGYRGLPGEFSMWVVLSDSDPQIELIQALAGPSIYAEWMEARGVGFHHVGYFTNNLSSDTRALEEKGFAVSQWGRGYGLDGDGGFAYFDSADRLGIIVELIQIPARRRPADREWVVSP